jgi:hypothetical protein
MKVVFESLTGLFLFELIAYNIVFFLRRKNIHFDLEKEKHQRNVFNLFIGGCCIVSLFMVGVL